MVGLGDLPGGRFGSAAKAVSADGSVVVGGSGSDSGDEAFRWTEAGGMRNLKEMLADDFRRDLTGWSLSGATGVSADGVTIVGFGNSPFEGWIASVPIE